MSKSFCYKLLGVLFCLLAGLNSSAFEVDGINYSTKSTGAVVAAGTYSGDIVIPETVTYDSVTYNVVGIANLAFRNCDQLTSVVLPETVTSIGQYAFSGCTSLVSVNIPSGVKAISLRTFYDCNSLASIDIPQAVTSIGNYAFYGCESLTSISIPAGVTAIGDYVFDGCKSLRTIEVDPANQNYHTVNGVLFSADYSELLLYPALKVGKQYNVPLTTAAIAPKAFAYVSVLQSLYIPGTVKNVGNGAFSGSSIKTAVFDEGVEVIGESAFANDMYLNSVYLPTTLIAIGGSAFSETNRLKEVISPADSALTITSDVFESVIRSRPSLPKLYLQPGAAANYRAAGWTGFNYTTAAELDLSTEYRVDSLVYVPLDSAYNLKISRVYTKIVRDPGIPCKLVISGNLCTVTQVAASTFSGCANITSVDIPGTVVRLFDNAFYNCSSLSQVTLNEGLTQLGTFTFGSCNMLSSIRIPASVTNISNKSFSKSASLANIYVDENNTKYASVDGVLFTKDKKKLVTYPCHHGDAYEVPYGTTSIETNAFLSTQIVNVTLPITLQTINMMAFSDASQLKTVTIPEGITKLNTSTFLNCTSLESIELPSTLTTMGNDVFKGDDSLALITLHAPVPPACSSSNMTGPFSMTQLANISLVVPAHCKGIYMADPVWGLFTNIEEDVLLGDVNGDGILNASDITALIDYLLDPTVIYINLDNADVNEDGAINAADISVLNDILLGIEVSTNSEPEPDPTEA